MPGKKTAKTPSPTESSVPTLPGGLLNETPIAYAVANTTIVAHQLFRNPLRRPSESGPWDDEADKVAWIDADTGLGCIMLRQTDGTISGYVGVPPEHPLFGFALDAVPTEIASSVHGGLTYARACEVNRFERRPHGQPREERYTICHTSVVRLVQEYRDVRTTEDEFGHVDLWWVGFDSNHPGDFAPKAHGSRRRKGDVYRDQSFVYGHCIALARRLRNAADFDEERSRAAEGRAALPGPRSGGA